MTKKEQRARAAQRALKNHGVSQYVAAVELGIAYGTFRKFLAGEEVFRTRPAIRERLENWVNTHK